MSASLVGSEMCIRDRFTALRMTGNRERLEQGDSRPHLGYTAKDCPYPVSYTHLTLPTICSV
eukprot:11600513-Alexandrium_andersonii.AAC.1